VLDVMRIRSYTRQMLQGLMVLHHTGIAHRDLKCANILLTADGCIKLCDFDSAKLRSSSIKTHRELTGSPLYTAPEIVNGSARNGCGLSGCHGCECVGGDGSSNSVFVENSEDGHFHDESCMCR
jgi:serine/threonine protein kinase